MNKVACIGSRDAGEEIITLCEDIGAWLAKNDWVIASGNAQGCDQAYARGANEVGRPHAVELYLPWWSYEKAAIVPNNQVYVADPKKYTAWFAIASEYHPSWTNLNQAVKKLHARNTGIVMSSVMVIAAPNPVKTGGGGTGQGIRIANGLDIPVLDLTEESTRVGIKNIIYNSEGRTPDDAKRPFPT